MAQGALGGLGLWLHLRGRPAGRLAGLSLPPGEGPLIVTVIPESAREAARQVLAALKQARPDLRLIAPGADGVPDFADDPLAAPDVIARARPAAVLIFGTALPPALIDACARAGVHVALIEGQIAAPAGAWSLTGGMQRRLLSDLSLVMVPDPANRAAALDQGVLPARLRMTGPVAAIHDPLPCNEAERMAMASMLRGRHVWLAAAVPMAEEAAVIEAHRAALRHSHRALLILVPTRTERAGPLGEELERAGFVIARRALDEDPLADVQVLLAEDMAEMGLWYRLAQVSFMGGTLSGRDQAARHPFEPAALGSAILHGPAVAAHATEWRQLDGAGAARAVASAPALAEAVADLTRPEPAAQLAGRAWTVATGGAGVARDIAAPLLALIEGRPI